MIYLFFVQKVANTFYQMPHFLFVIVCGLTEKLFKIPETEVRLVILQAALQICAAFIYFQI